MKAILIFLVLNIAMYLVVSFVMWDIAWVLEAGKWDISRRGAVISELILYQGICYCVYKIIG